MDPVAPTKIKFLQDEYTFADISRFKQVLWCRRCGKGFGSTYMRKTFYRTMTCYAHNPMAPKEFRELLA